MACWSTKAAIRYLPKRIKIGEKLLWMAYRNSPTLFERYHPRPPTASSSQDWGFATPKVQSLLSQERVKLRTSRCWYIHRVYPNKSSLKKIWRKASVGVSRDSPNVLSTPIITGTGKATNFKFCMHIHRIDWNKSPLKSSGKVAVGVLRDSGTL